MSLNHANMGRGNQQCSNNNASILDDYLAGQNTNNKLHFIWDRTTDQFQEPKLYPNFQISHTVTENDIVGFFENLKDIPNYRLKPIQKQHNIIKCGLLL